MSMPSLIFTASHSEAKELRLNNDLPDEDVFKCGGMESLKASMLRAILNNETWDVGMEDDFVKVASRGNEWAWQMPQDFVTTLAAIDEAEMLRSASAWAATEEMDCESQIGIFLLRGMKRIALRALETEQPMFLYLSL